MIAENSRAQRTLGDAARETVRRSSGRVLSDPAAEEIHTVVVAHMVGLAGNRVRFFNQEKAIEQGVASGTSTVPGLPPQLLVRDSRNSLRRVTAEQLLFNT